MTNEQIKELEDILSAARQAIKTSTIGASKVERKLNECFSEITITEKSLFESRLLNIHIKNIPREQFKNASIRHEIEYDNPTEDLNTILKEQKTELQHWEELFTKQQQALGDLRQSSIDLERIILSFKKEKVN